MKPMMLNLKNMKKVKDDGTLATFRHPKGHEIVVAKKMLPAIQRKQIESLPLHLAEGGEAEDRGPEEMTQEPAPRGTTAFEENFPELSAGISKWLNPPSPMMAPAAAEPHPADSHTAAAKALEAAALSHTAAAQARTPAAPSQPMGNPGAGNSMSDIGAAYLQGQNAISQQQAVDSAKAQATERIGGEDLAQRSNEAENVHQDLENQMVQRRKFLEDYEAGHIDPKHFQESQTSNQRIATGIGLFLGGMGNAFTHQGNPAFDMLNKQIDRDIDAQKMNMDKQRNLLSANHEVMGDTVLAHNMTKINMNDIYDHRIQLEAAKLGTQQAAANAAMAHSKFALENAGLLQSNIARQSLLRQSGQSDADPASYVRYVVPEHHQKAVFDEIERAQDTRHMGASILEAFDKAVGDNTVMRTGAGMLRTPATVLALHQAMQPTFKDLEGTVRQAAMDNTFNNITPKPGDMESTIKEKRHALVQYLQSKMAAPTAKGFGIDLDKFSSTKAIHDAAEPVQRATKDGQIALFDPKTKKFLGYKK